MQRLDSGGYTRYISATVASSNGSEGSQSMQRVRVAMTGLAAVMVFIGLASVAFNYESKETAVTAIGAAKPETVANMTHTVLSNTSDEPLAELGIAPRAVATAGAAEGKAGR
jgi:hypothetical protein